MSLKNILDRFFYLEDEEEYSYEEVQKPAPQELRKAEEQQIVQSKMKRERKVTTSTTNNSNKLVSLQTAAANKQAKVVLAEPRVYAEAQDIAEHLKNKRSIIVNLQRIDRDQAIRIIDFLSGTVYALGGEIQRVGTNIFLCTPENVEVTGEISEYLYDDMK